MNDCAPLAPEEVRELHDKIREYQERQGKSMRDVGTIIEYEVGEAVRVRAGHRETKLHIVMGPWSTCAVVHEKHPTARHYYKLQWTTRGAGKEQEGTISKRYFPWTALKKMQEGPEKARSSAEAVTNGVADKTCCLQEVDEAIPPKPRHVEVSLAESSAAIASVLSDVIAGKRAPFTNVRNSCHVDVFVMMELSAVAAAPWRSRDVNWQKNGKEWVLEDRGTGR